MIRTTIGLVIAIIVALFFTALTGFILFDDVFNHAAPITIKHAGTLGVLVAVAYFGDRIVPEFRRKHLATASGCVLLFVVGLGMCVVLSSGRNASVTITKNADVRKSNDDRGTLQSALSTATEAVKSAQATVAEAEKAVPKALADVSRSCPGKNCGAKRRTLKEARDSAASASARLAQANERYYQAYGLFSTRPPEKFENADLKGSAAVFAKLPFVTAGEDAIEAMLALAIPFLQSLLTEIALLVSVAIARGHMIEIEAEYDARRAARIEKQLPDNIRVFSLPAPVAASCPDTEAVVAGLRRAERKGRRKVSNGELADILHISKGEASKRVATAVAQGAVQKAPNGRYVDISLPRLV